jgi:hypothetical protein
MPDRRRIPRSSPDSFVATLWLYLTGPPTRSFHPGDLYFLTIGALPGDNDAMGDALFEKMKIIQTDKQILVVAASDA